MNASSVDNQTDEWIPFLVRCASKEQQTQVVSALSSAITAFVSDNKVYIYGADAYDSVKKLPTLLELTIERRVCAQTCVPHHLV